MPLSYLRLDIKGIRRRAVRFYSRPPWWPRLRWKFEPAANGAATRAATLTFTFHLNEEKRPAAETTPVFVPPYKVEIVGDSSSLVRTVNH